MGGKEAIRVLHVVGDPLSHGGVATWLLRVLRRINRDRFQLDFHVQSVQPGDYDREIRALGSRITPLESSGGWWRYGRRLRQIMREGQYRVVHSHVQRESGYVLRAAAQESIPVRIAHSHALAGKPASSPLKRWRRGLWGRWLRKYATHGLACSAAAGAGLFGEDWERDPRFRVLGNGIELGEFRKPPDRGQLRGALGLPPDAPVVGHVGRFAAAKNHEFLVSVAAEVVRLKPEVCFLLVGDGVLRARIEALARQKELADHFVFAGSRADVPQLMLAGMDLFIFPSLREGLGVAVLEAQAAGLPVIVSDRVSTEVDVVAGLIERLPLEGGPAVWAEHVVRRLESNTRGDNKAALEILARGPFTVEKSVEALEQLYAG